MNGLWLLPTRRRPGSLKAFFETAVATGMQTGGAVLIQTDDWAELHDQYEAITLPPSWSFYITDREGYAGKVQEIFETGDLDSVEWIGILADDLHPETMGWDTQLVQRVNGHNIVAANDLWQAPKRMNGAMVFSRELLSAVGYFSPEGMSHLFVDDIWETLGRDTGCVTWALDVIVKHRNAALTGQMDDTVAKVKSYWPEDEKIFRKWRSEGRKTATNAIFDLVESHGVKVFRPDLSGVSLLISVPSHDGKYEAEFVRSLMATEKTVTVAGGQIEIAELTYCADIALARARIFGVFLRSNHTHMLMIDADMGWVPQDVLRLFEHGHDFVCAAGPKKRYPLEFAFESATKDGQAKPMRMSPDGMAFEVTGVGMAFSMISRACAEKMVEAYKDTLTFEVDNGIKEYGIFDPYYEGKRRLSEDYSFCRRWTNIGGKIHMLPHIRLKHVGPHTFEGCLMDDLIARSGSGGA